MDKKYELTGETKEWLGHVLNRIRALRDFGNVKAGDLGGWIEKEENLSHEGDAWVGGNAKVCGDARVCGNAWVYGDAKVFGEALVCDDAWVCDNAWVSDDAWVCGNAEIENTRDYMCVGPMGSRNDYTTIFRAKNGAKVKCGCFLGTLDEFYEAVDETHGDNEFGREYKKLIELARIRFGEEKE